MLALTGCTGMLAVPSPPKSSLRPVVPAPVIAPHPSPRSKRLAMYYAQLQADDLAQGLLRRDGGGPDTGFDAADLARNFERIAFYGEYPQGAELTGTGDTADVLRRWQGPVRLDVIFGTSLDQALRDHDKAELARYATRLARATGHPITLESEAANFHVLIMGEDDRPQALQQIRTLVPGISYETMAQLGRLPRDVHCLVLGFGTPDDAAIYGSAIALIRAEHPDLMRRACLHEEIAQGLGLRNDYALARPSIFNDDSEFALLTTQDEMMLRMLYDPRLKPGMSADEARPIVQTMAREMMSGT